MSEAGRRKLGEILLQSAVISEKALRAGLAAQKQRGQRLGSALVQLGLLDGDALASSLSQQLGFPAADSRMLDGMEPRALMAIPAELRVKYQVLPVRLEGRWLHLAAVEPQRHELMSHLAAALRVQIRPYVLPQGLFAAYLARAELIATGRAITGPMGVPVSRGPAGQHAASGPAASPGGSTADAGVVEDPLLDLVYLDEVTAASPAARRSTSELEIDISFESEPEEAEQPALEVLTQRLDSAERTDDVVAALLQPPIPGKTLAVLLLPRGDLGSLLGAWGTELAQSEARALVVPLNVPSLLQRATTEKRVTVGEANSDSIQPMIATFLRRPAAQVGCAAPICLGDRVLNLLYVQATEPIPDAALRDLNALVKRAAQTYARLIQRKRS